MIAKCRTTIIISMKELSKSERTRQFIIESTAPVFNVKGLAGTSLSDLTEATNLTKGSIYGNFEDKEAVALAAFDYNWALVKKIITEKVQACKTHKEMLLVYAGIYNSTENSLFPVGGCPLLNTTVEADDTHDVLRKKAADAILSWKKNLATIIKKGIAAKEFRADVDVNKIAFSMIALIEGAILVNRATKNRTYSDLIFESLEDLITGIEVKKKS
jgi:TetR/AcrR family transcriptional repressor of nem operon